MMTVHILVPARIYDVLDQADFAWFNGDFQKKLTPVFSDVKINVVRKEKLESFDLYFMGKQTTQHSDREVINYVVKLIKDKFGSKLDRNPIVKLNYAVFNSRFNPVADPKVELKQPEPQPRQEFGEMGEFDYDKLSLNYQAVEPKYSFDQVVLSPAVKGKIEEAIGIIEVENKVFDEWGLRAIIPFAASAMSFYGPPGTGKSMAAEAVAHKLGKKILKATYADIESKYHGEGPKMVKAIFRAAERDGAVLFLDESDSLLSKRLTNVSDGSAQAINSMRSQLLISLEQFKGIVIFATNLVVNYDKAFVSRLINIEFTYPTVDEREKIWWNHLRTEQVRVPLAEDVNIRHLAENYKFCGRDIKNAVKSACVSTAMQKRNVVTQNDFIGACNRTELEKEQILAANDHTQID